MTPSTSELPSSTTLSSSSLKSNTLLSSSSTSSLLNSFKESESLGWTPSTSHFELRCETERLLRAQNIELPTHSKKRSVTEFLENRKK
ncbi:hypothetical protein HMI54_010533 [Coelomomyces lativittatus]|nr:hypothetical protein HMI55_004268 [Coelomomyces lativittatus]KAJ1500770.1 hypothetical protein HMI54_010533 [Coelomomyces lativittatus]